ncbi:MAG TPA: clostripain-related cysteine peptidase [Candidatus Babeliales bacterium]|nr:clostripain-related cysteine peptidase [Candidatus Babeliales bacterium]
MIKRVSFLSVVLAVFCSASFVSAGSWRVLMYSDSSDNLTDMIMKNITDMMRGKPNDSVEFFLQLHAYYNVGLRYKITDKGLQFIEEVALSDDSCQDFVDAATWGFAGHTADHTMLIFSNHGWGIMDPQWDEHDQAYYIDGDACAVSCPVNKHAMIGNHVQHRGFMFNHTTKEYLTNQDLVAGFEIATQDCLGGKSLDVLAFDTCMGGMIEIAYQLAPFARYMVGCQSCSLKDGFDYQALAAVLNSAHNTPRTVAAGIVNGCDAYYDEHDDSGQYTYSAFDLIYVYEVCTAMNTLIDYMRQLPNCQEVFNATRVLTPRFCIWPIYTDVIEFFDIFVQQLALSGQTDQLFTVIDALQGLKQAHDKMIITCCGGYKTAGVANGSAMYCPFNCVDGMYQTTLFAQACGWSDLLYAMQDPQQEAIKWACGM